MAMPYRGDEDFGANRGSYSPKEDGDPIKRTGPGTTIMKPRFDSLRNSVESSNNSGCIRRVQERLGESCCSCIEDIPTWLFLLIILFLILLIAAVITGLVHVLQPKSWTAKNNEDEYRTESKDFNISDDEMPPTFEYLISLMPQNMVYCRGYGFTCTAEPEHVINVYQRCDGIKDCLDGSDEEFCTNCQTSFKCPTKSGNSTLFYKCLRAEEVCNGKSDCPDNSDESFCVPTTQLCQENQFFCFKTGVCIPKKLRCDGEKHCANNEDEEDCKNRCQSGSLWCPSTHKCIPKWNLCDGISDCSDGRDENNCTCKECCGRDRVLCPKSKVCIRRVHLCDGHPDCPGGSDEENCLKSCMVDVLNKSDVVYCADGRPYQRKLACGGFIQQCRRSCDQCDSRYAFSCKNEDLCLPKSMLCDGKSDCADGSDEHSCKKNGFVSCRSNYLHSKPKWIDQSQVCDGVEDCLDGTDEINCNDCKGNGVYCAASRTCIPIFKRCDGKVDCPDTSDEQNCTCEECAFRQVSLYKCEQSNTCIRYSNGCWPGDCSKETRTDKLFCLTQQVLRRR